MAKPIKETPVLTGQDAAAFIDKMVATKKNKASKEERARIKQNFALLTSIAGA